MHDRGLGRAQQACTHHKRPMCAYMGVHSPKRSQHRLTSFSASAPTAVLHNCRRIHRQRQVKPEGSRSVPATAIGINGAELTSNRSCGRNAKNMTPELWMVRMVNGL